jgi:pSer/pThr/pTyr-binding forkhead associated (FHA) protein
VGRATEHLSANAYVEDLGSANGTWLNDSLVRGRTLLHGGDLIRV